MNHLKTIPLKSNYNTLNIESDQIFGDYNPCQNMRMKTNWLEAEEVVENEDQPEMDLLTTQIPVVYPNPTKGGFYIDIKEDAIYAITLMDMHGKHIDLPFSTVEKDAFIALDGLRTGIYILRLNANQTQHIYKIVKID